MIKTYLAQHDADRFLRSQNNGIGDCCLIQFYENEETSKGGEIAWFCKSGGEKIICPEKGVSYKLGNGKNCFRIIERNTTFIHNGQLYNLGNKGIISRPKIIKSSAMLRKAWNKNGGRKRPKERFGVIKRRDNGEIINYAFGLFEQGRTMVVYCFAFQDEVCLYQQEIHIFEPLNVGHNFEFVGQKFYTYSVNPGEICFENIPKLEL